MGGFLSYSGSCTGRARLAIGMPPGPSGIASAVPVPPVTTEPACVTGPPLDCTSVVFAQAARNPPATARPPARSSNMRRDIRPRTSFG